MPTVLSFVCLLICTASLSGQRSLLPRLADEICDCLEQSAVPDRAAADDCLRSVLPTEQAVIRKRYDLNMGLSAHRRHLAGQMVDLLMARCPLLASLRPAVIRRELSWSDEPAPAEPRSPQLPFAAARTLPPLPGGTVVGEPDPRPRISGTLMTRPGSLGLRLRDTTGREHHFELPAAAARKRDFRAGQFLSLTYRREWRREERRVVRVVVTID